MQFLGQQNVTNAYVSGMREDLNAFGNELNYYVVSCESKAPKTPNSARNTQKCVLR
jgi:hypothetical protein